jgi:hypothetical protein
MLLAGVTLLLILFAGLRSGMPDYESYVATFWEAQMGNWNASFDFGYTLLNMITGKLFHTPIAIFLLMAFLSVTVTVKCYKEYTQYAAMAILFYFVHTYFLREMVQIRAGFACAMCLYNIRNIEQEKFKEFAFFQVVAMSMHLGSVMFLAVPFLKRINFSVSTWYWLLGVCFVIGTFAPLGDWVQRLSPNKYTFRALSYVGGQFDITLGVLRNLATLKQLAMCLIGLLFYDTLKEKIRYFDVLFAAYLFATCWLMLWNDFAIIAARLATFCSVGEPVLFASLLHLVSIRWRPVLAVALIVCAIMFLMYNLNREEMEYMEYKLAI